MMAAIEADRAQRRARRTRAARAAPPRPPRRRTQPRATPSLSGREGVGGVFQVLRKGLRTGEFAFNGFRNAGRAAGAR